MIEIEATTREWGRSIGVVIPKEEADKINLKADEEIRIFVEKKQDEFFEGLKKLGPLKLKGSVQKLLDEIDEEFWDD